MCRSLQISQVRLICEYVGDIWNRNDYLQVPLCDVECSGTPQ